MPGGFTSSEMYAKIKSDISGPNKVNISAQPATWPPNSFPLHTYYISRFQVWEGGNERGDQNACAGTWTSGSCVYGVGDLPRLLIRPELIAHKLYLERHPAAFFCLYEKIRERALDYANQKRFNASNYEQLPQVQLSKGKSIDYVKFYF
uniref:Uncharacterized protein n=1 Tax=Panagrolaimus sp. PS1159 TaxID=55785 RepID=A0AC35GFW5_9BILA